MAYNGVCEVCNFYEGTHEEYDYEGELTEKELKLLNKNHHPYIPANPVSELMEGSTDKSTGSWWGGMFLGEFKELYGIGIYYRDLNDEQQGLIRKTKQLKDYLPEDLSDPDINTSDTIEFSDIPPRDLEELLTKFMDSKKDWKKYL